MKSKTVRTVLALALAAFVAVGCGGGDDSEGETGTGTETPSETETGGEDGGAASGGDITITSPDTSFDTTEIEVAAGEEVNVTYENEDEGVPHNIHFMLGGEDDPATEVEEGPTTQELSFTAPEEPGDYDYQCDVHPQQMTGTLTVTES